MKVYTISAYMANKKGEESKIPTIPTLNLGKRPSMFSGSKSFGQVGGVKKFTPIPIRITQNKGSGSGK